MKYDIEMLKLDLKKAAIRCREGKKKLVEAQRALSTAPKDTPYSRGFGDSGLEIRGLVDAIHETRGVAASASLTMTKLCVFRAHLRGRTHLSEGSGLLGFVREWIDELSVDYMLVEQADKPAA